MIIRYAWRPWTERTMIEYLAIVGEVHTELLHHSIAISSDSTERLLRFAEGERVLRSQRPVRYAVSPQVLTGVDCRLPTSSGAAVRGVGTVVSRAAITEGRLVQASAHLRLRRAEVTQRQPWSHYLARRGVVETIGRTDTRHLVQGFLAGTAPATGAAVLDLGALCARAMKRVQSDPALDHRTAIRAAPGRLRWAVTPANTDPAAVVLSIGADGVRRLRLSGFDASVDAHIDLCHELALHDWLLAVLTATVERGLDARRNPDVLRGLRPAVDHLMHLWMPGARTDPRLHDVWDAVERHPGMSRQWRVNVDRVRDQLALRTLERLSASPVNAAGE
jgi:hypothetical protein